MASLREKFVEELDYLRRLGRVFARDNPALEPFLGASANDPDVERLLEGFAFLTAKLRLKIEDDFPEITQPLLQLLDPSCLRPTPCMTVMRFIPMQGAISASHVLPRGTAVQSSLIQGQRCQFRTCTDVALLPLAIESLSASHSNDRTVMRLDLVAFPGSSLHEIGSDSIEFHLSCEESTAHTLYCWLGHYLQRIQLQKGDIFLSLPPDCIQFSGFEPKDALLPQPSSKLDGYRLLQEYFVYPARFHFFRLTGLRHFWPKEPCQRIQFEFRFRRPMPHGTRIENGDLSLFCTPAVNLFEETAEPINLDSEALNVQLTPAMRGRGECGEIFSVDDVTSSRRIERAEGTQPAFTFLPQGTYNGSCNGSLADEVGQGVYVHSVEDALVNNGTTHRISFFRNDNRPYVAKNAVARIGLTCTNGDVPCSLEPGSICHQTDTTTRVAEFNNLIQPTPTYPPVLDGETQWKWISNLSPNFLALQTAEAFRSFLRAYDVPGLSNIQLARMSQRKLNAIRSISATPVDRLFQERMLRGGNIRLELEREGFSSEGEMYLFCTVLNHALSLFFSAESFHVLSVYVDRSKEPYEWPKRLGSQPLM
ncbi:TPA: type VI secretion system baseplate subunit TssF [Pseudomonas aeruginosa]|uniref:type VI secretion system baseplate subunit TssF n=1 Tax=Pseudomonas aeruginosa TaxID=287 RepID=UPI000F87C5A8|nr:type VI secretion system baseplate subunit TssF [Pseudomonas aeruginosa]EKJ9724558.1 type VI secretion system baseplate subunit TssF [Pseudomonas aeruginosa]EKW8358479.1 type VI secretion system baseplate subunit TssF [Pseudomonas aeruginosa]RUJ11991.1 type VI secretion system baseplate subunit TssF [Pseudomonas aeruginosa]HBO9439752.1 type VI secretion system baseplate subunit TssF [Pseudomonas aeruginosa]HBO9513110.1 type VI secretion system baseplate subunit TssF [Pseudomonas aeruginosa]